MIILNLNLKLLFYYLHKTLSNGCAHPCANHWLGSSLVLCLMMPRHQGAKLHLVYSSTAASEQSSVIIRLWFPKYKSLVIIAPIGRMVIRRELILKSLCISRCLEILRFLTQNSWSEMKKDFKIICPCIDRQIYWKSVFKRCFWAKMGPKPRKRVKILKFQSKIRFSL